MGKRSTICLALVNSDRSGPALGWGRNETQVKRNAAQRGVADFEGLAIVQITRNSSRRVKRGNPDAWREVQ